MPPPFLAPKRVRWASRAHPPPACVELLTRVYPQPAEEGEQGGEAAEANPEDAAISAMVTSTADDWERCAVGCIPDVAVMR